MFTLTGGLLWGAPLDVWHWRSPAPTGLAILGLGANPELYVGVGEFGTIILSDNGQDWVRAESGTEVALRGVGWGNGRWVAVGDFGVILTSDNGRNWTLQSLEHYFDLNAVTWANGLFVAVGDNTSILTSPDGQGWSLRASGTHPLEAVAWGHGVFVAAGGRLPTAATGGGITERDAGEPLILVSEDGLDWTRVETPVPGQVSCLAFGADRFVAGTLALGTMVSRDGRNWDAGAEMPDYGWGWGYRTMAYVSGRFIASYGAATSIPYDGHVSADGYQWASEPWDTLGGQGVVRVRAMIDGPQGAVAATGRLSDSRHNGLMASADGRHWRSSERRLPEVQGALAFAGGYFFLRRQPAYHAYEYLQETTYLISSNGRTWDSVEASPGGDFGMPAYGAGRWVAPGPGGRLLISEDAVSWREVRTTETNDLREVAFALGRFLVTGPNGTLWTSSDGVAWQRQPVDSTNTLGLVVSALGRLAIPEPEAAAILVSTNGVDWARRPLPPTYPVLLGLVGWEEGWCALAATNAYGGGRLLHSVDGEAWTVDDTVPADDLRLLARGGGWLLAFRDNVSRTFPARRAGLASWTTQELPWPGSLGTGYYWAPAAVAYGHDTFLLTHAGGYVVQSDPLTNAAPRITAPVTAVTDDVEAHVTLHAWAQGAASLRYQWRRDGTNLASATWPHLRVKARETTEHAITVRVENDAGGVDSDPATLATAAPASLEVPASAAYVLVCGTPRARYRIERCATLAPTPAWESYGQVEIPSFGTAARWNDLGASVVYPAAPSGLFRAVFDP